MIPDNLVCPSCKGTNLMLNSVGDELLCQNDDCKALVGIYDKGKFRLIPTWVFP